MINSLSEKWKGAIYMLAALMTILGGIAGIYSCSRVTGPELSARCAVSELPDRARTYKPTLADCTITNSGNSEATDVRLYLPSKILGFQSYDESAEICIAKDYLEIKSLRPETSIRVMVWSDHFFSWDKKFRLNSREAAGEIEIGKVLFGPIGRAIDWLENYAILILLPIAFILIIIVLPIDNRQSKDEKDKL